MAERVSKVVLYMLMVGMLFAGLFNTVAMKLQNSQQYFNDDKQKWMDYNHPFFQTFWMFIGEVICLPIYLILKFRDIKKHGSFRATPGAIDARKIGLRLDINVLLMAIPCWFDIIASTLMFVGLTMIAASIYQMLRGCIVFVATIMSILFLNKRYYRHHWTALSIVVVGVAVVGASPLIYPDNSEETSDSSNPTLGLILVLSGQIFSGLTMVWEEKLFRLYYIHPLQMVGWEGVWGLLIYAVVLVILQNIPWHNSEICPYGTVEDSLHAFYEFGENYLMWVFGIFSILSITLYNSTNVSVTKYASCVQKATINTSKTALVWIFFLIYPGKAQERFIWLQTVGFALIIFGTLMYNEILIIPFFGMNKNTQEIVEAREGSIYSAKSNSITYPSKYYSLDDDKDDTNILLESQNKPINTSNSLVHQTTEDMNPAGRKVTI